MATGIDQIVSQAITAQFGGLQWFTACILALSISAVMSAIAWMISNFLESSSLKGWAREEITQFVFSATIIGLLFPLLILINSLSIAYTGGDPISLSQAFLTELGGTLSTTYGHLIGLKVWFTLLSSFQVPLSVLTVAIAAVAGPEVLPATAVTLLTNTKVPYGAPFSLSVGPLGAMLKFMNPVIFTVLVQQQLLIFIAKIMLTLILPVGLAMRAFPITRKTGSTLIAIAITAYVVYPVTLAFNGVIYHQAETAFSTPNYFNPSSRLLSSIVIRDSPPLGEDYLNKTQDIFIWEVAVPNATYRVWQSVDCSVAPGVDTFTSTSTDLTPPYNQNYLRWAVSTQSDVCIVPGHTVTIPGTTTCYSRIQNGTVAAGRQVTLDLANVPTLVNDNKYTLVMDAAEIGGDNQNGTQVSTFYLGDPCQQNLWKSTTCDMSSYYNSNGLNDTSYMKMTLSGMTGMMQSLQTIAGMAGNTLGTGGIFSALWTPSAAGYFYLYFTSQLPSIMFPVAMAIFTLVISAMIFVSSFRSISGILKGETKIAELGRLV